MRSRRIHTTAASDRNQRLQQQQQYHHRHMTRCQHPSILGYQLANEPLRGTNSIHTIHKCQLAPSKVQ